MSVSAIFGSRFVVPPPSSAMIKSAQPLQRLVVGGGGYGCGLAIVCSSRPQKKVIKHHMKMLPRKSRPFDIQRSPAIFPPMSSLSLEWSFVSEATAEAPPQPI